MDFLLAILTIAVVLLVVGMFLAGYFFMTQEDEEAPGVTNIIVRPHSKYNDPPAWYRDPWRRYHGAYHHRMGWGWPRRPYGPHHVAKPHPRNDPDSAA